jgi:hypothetical protein
MWRIGRAPNRIPIYSYSQQDATSHNVFIFGNCSTCFGWHFHPSSVAHTTVSTASGICHTVTAICRYRGSVGTGLSVLWVAYATSDGGPRGPKHVACGYFMKGCRCVGRMYIFYGIVTVVTMYIVQPPTPFHCMYNLMMACRGRNM